MQRVIARLASCLRRAVPLGPALLIVFAVGAARAEFDIDRVEKSVVRIYVQSKRGERTVRSFGSGFVINDKGYVATNHHVVDGAVWVKVPDGSWDKLLEAEVVWSDEFVDLAVIRVKGLDRPPVPLAVPEPKRGTGVWAVGFPGSGDSMVRRVKGKRALQATVTSGVVGKVFIGAHRTDPRTFRRMIQHSAETNPGNSGGPLFNDCHQVIGIHTYGKRTILEVRVDSRTGKRVAVGRTSHGIFNGSHVSVLIKNLTSRNIAYTPATARCVLTAKGPGGVPLQIYIYIAVATLLAGVSTLLALRRPRERIVRVVETYSEMIRRKRSDMGAIRSTEATAGGGGPQASTAAAAAAAAPGPGWRLEGRDRNGQAIELSLSDAELRDAPDGIVVGRKSMLVNLVIDDRSVSRRHAKLVSDDDGIGVVDLNSTHGTKVGDREVAAFADPVRLRSGETVTLGGVTLTLSRR